MKTNDQRDASLDRRDFLLAAAGAAGAALIPATWARAAAARGAGEDVITVGVIGCGGRGTGAAFDALAASPRSRIVALADVFRDRLDASRGYLIEHHADRATVDPSRCHVGFDAYRQLLADPPDVVILATPPHFRPMHLAAAVNAGCHVFTEKPVAVDPAGFRVVMEAARLAKQKSCSIVAGTQRRHEKCYREAIQRIHEGAIGEIVSASCYWNQGGLWMNPRNSEWSDMEWQLRNWLYFTWLSGDHIVEQHVHNIDVIHWAIGAEPVRAVGMGGRQVRIDPAYGNVFDHFAIEFEFPGGVTVHSYCRQIDGCAGRVQERLVGTKGVATLSPGSAVIDGEQSWRFEGENPNPYVEEHKALIAAIDSGVPINEGEQVARSSLSAIMGRISAYTGKELLWSDAVASKLDLSPAKYEMDALPAPAVAVPGKSPLV